MGHTNRTMVCTVSALICLSSFSHLMLVPRLSRLYDELCQNDDCLKMVPSVSVLLTTKVMTAWSLHILSDH